MEIFFDKFLNKKKKGGKDDLLKSKTYVAGVVKILHKSGLLYGNIDFITNTLTKPIPALNKKSMWEMILQGDASKVLEYLNQEVR